MVVSHANDSIPVALEAAIVSDMALSDGIDRPIEGPWENCSRDRAIDDCVTVVPRDRVVGGDMHKSTVLLVVSRSTLALVGATG